jgi:hypothetical protein
LAGINQDCFTIPLLALFTKIMKLTPSQQTSNFIEKHLRGLKYKCLDGIIPRFSGAQYTHGLLGSLIPEGVKTITGAANRNTGQAIFEAIGDEVIEWINDEKNDGFIVQSPHSYILWLMLHGRRIGTKKFLIPAMLKRLIELRDGVLVKGRAGYLILRDLLSSDNYPAISGNFNEITSIANVCDVQSQGPSLVNHCVTNNIFEAAKILIASPNWDASKEKVAVLKNIKRNESFWTQLPDRRRIEIEAVIAGQRDRTAP